MPSAVKDILLFIFEKQLGNYISDDKIKEIFGKIEIDLLKTCIHVMSTGKNKGAICSKKCPGNDYCKIHKKMYDGTLNQCVYRSKKGQQCSRFTEGKYCNIHRKKEELERNDESEELERNDESEELETKGEPKELERNDESEELETKGEPEELERNDESEELETKGEPEELERNDESEELETKGEPEELERNDESEELETKGEPNELERNDEPEELETKGDSKLKKEEVMYFIPPQLEEDSDDEDGYEKYIQNLRKKRLSDKFENKGDSFESSQKQCTTVNPDDLNIIRDHQNYVITYKGGICRKWAQDKMYCRKVTDDDDNDVYIPEVEIKMFCRKGCYKDSLFCKEHGFTKSGEPKKQKIEVVDANILHGCEVLSREKFPRIVHKLDCKFNTAIKQYVYQWLNFVVRKTSFGNIVIGTLFKGFWLKELTNSDIERCQNNGLLYKRVPYSYLYQQFTMGNKKDYVLDLPGEGFISFEEIRKRRPSLYIKYWKIWNQELLRRKEYAEKYDDQNELFTEIGPYTPHESIKKIQKHAKEYGCYPYFEKPQNVFSHYKNLRIEEKEPTFEEVIQSDFDAKEWCKNQGIDCVPMLHDYPNYTPEYEEDHRFAFWLEPKFRRQYLYGDNKRLFENHENKDLGCIYTESYFYPPKNYEFEVYFGQSERIDRYFRQCQKEEVEDSRLFNLRRINYFCDQ